MKRFRDKLIKYIVSKKEELYSFLFFVMLLGFLQLFVDYKKDPIISGVAFVGLFISAFLLLRAVRILFRKRLKDEILQFFSKGFNKLFKNLKRFSKSIAKRLGLYKEHIFIKGKDKVEFVYGELKRKNAKEKEKIKNQKLPKWSELTNNRERVRYIYTVFLSRQSNYGYRVEPAMTPLDISKVYAENNEQRRLFECYNEVRYTDDNSPVSGGIVKELLSVIKKH